jgi:integrase
VGHWASSLWIARPSLIELAAWPLLKLTPHQFRHLAAKIVLDANAGAYELVRQLLGHKNLKTTTNFYAGIDTRPAYAQRAAHHYQALQSGERDRSQSGI